MSEEKLRALLAEARDGYVGHNLDCSTNVCDECSLAGRIDAALAEPVDFLMPTTDAKEVRWEMVQMLKRERDEARKYAEERNDEANKLQRYLNMAAQERDEARVEVERLKAIESRWMKRTVEAEAHSRRIYEAACPGFSFNEADDVAWDVRAAKLNIANEAYQRGAEAMREAAALCVDDRLSDKLTDAAKRIRALPVPEGKP